MSDSEKVIEVGKEAPAFAAPDQFGEQVSSASFAGEQGKKILLSFHPLAWTGICTKQMQTLDKLHDRLTALGVVPFGVSVDPAPCKKAWGESMGIAQLRMICDFWPHGKIAQDMGIFIEKNGTSGRGNILIENGSVIWSKANRLSEFPDFDEILAFLEK
jgi:peroxiredoxin